jgi:hypothetical protein
MAIGWQKKKSHLTKSDVIFLYRKLLNRDPENSDVIEKKLLNDSLTDAILEFVESREYQENLIDCSTNQVDTNTSLKDFFELSDRVVNQWTKLGEEKPHWSVISDPKFMPEEVEKFSSEFWESGVISVDQIFSKCKSLGLEINRAGIGLELGAGVGRLTLPLSRSFHKLLALDVSIGNLTILKNKLTNFENIETKLIQNFEDFKYLKNIDFFISLITLQHNPPPLQEFILRNIFHSMNNKAIGIFQIPIQTPHYSFSAQEFLKRSNSEMDMFSFPLSKIYDLCRECNLTIVHVEQDNLAGSKHISCTFYVQKI